MKQVNVKKPYKTAMVRGLTAERTIELIKKGHELGADIFGVQLCLLKDEEKTTEKLARIFSACKDKPVYVTNYKTGENTDKTHDQLANELVALLDINSNLIIDVMGDMFCSAEYQLTYDENAVKKQKELIKKIHDKGGRVLMSSHLIDGFTGSEKILEIALAQQSRDVDFVKIVSKCNTDEEFLQTIDTYKLLNENVTTPYLYLTSGEKCQASRLLGVKLGNCMWLCSVEHDEVSTKEQPLLEIINKMHGDDVL